MQVFRICRDIHQALDGEGARLFGGRWNSPGFPVIYTSEHLSLCILEQLVHLDLDLIPTNWVTLTLEIPDTIEGETLSSLPVKKEEAKRIGDEWLKTKKTLYLKVSSFVVPGEYNVLINPLHHDMKRIKVSKTSHFQFDQRLLR
ncbi:MAG: RES family NAD+ phosphorylase [Proteobacteria bacterium]|nr:RES family NAD+ phosphorylase [Pseudomonadota bacterium]